MEKGSTFQNLNKLKIFPIVIACVLFVLAIVIAGLSSIATEQMLMIMLGIAVLGIGVARVCYGYFAFHSQTDAKFNIWLGGIDAVWGVLALCLLAIDGNGVFALLFGIWLLVAGIIEISLAIKAIFAKTPWVAIFIEGCVGLVFGVLMTVVPMGTTAALAIITAAYLFINAFTTVFISLLASPKSTVANYTAAETKQPAPQSTPAFTEAPAAADKKPIAQQPKTAADKPAAKSAPKSGTAKTTKK